MIEIHWRVTKYALFRWERRSCGIVFECQEYILPTSFSLGKVKNLFRKFIEKFKMARTIQEPVKPPEEAGGVFKFRYCFYIIAALFSKQAHLE